MTKFKVTVENAKVNISKLYLRQTFGGSGMNQLDVTPHKGLGRTIVNNWGIYDDHDTNANLVAYAHGTQTFGGKWNNCFTLEFVVDRYKGSTLQVMGANGEDEANEWAIVGGTGEFAMARGIIKRKVYGYEEDKITLTQELTSIEFICQTTKEVVHPTSPARPGIPTRLEIPAPKKLGPWGGNGGSSLKDMEGKSQRLESLTIYHHGTVEGFQFSYVGEDGQIRTSGILGKNLNRWITEINFGPSEYVKQIIGAGHRDNPSKLCQFKIVTNNATYGPYGTWEGTPFSYTVPENVTVVGFFASINQEQFITTIGAYTIPK